MFKKNNVENSGIKMTRHSINTEKKRLKKKMFDYSQFVIILSRNPIFASEKIMLGHSFLIN